MNPIALVTEKVRLRKRSIGKIGSFARRSTNGNAARSTTAAIAMAMIGADAHG